jgi:hypothetical protein
VDYQTVKITVLKITQDFLKDVPLEKELDVVPRSLKSKKSIVERNTVKNLTNDLEFGLASRSLSRNLSSKSLE